MLINLGEPKKWNFSPSSQLRARQSVRATHSLVLQGQLEVYLRFWRDIKKSRFLGLGIPIAKNPIIPFLGQLEEKPSETLEQRFLPTENRFCKVLERFDNTMVVV